MKTLISSFHENSYLFAAYDKLYILLKRIKPLAYFNCTIKNHKNINNNLHAYL